MRHGSLFSGIGAAEIAAEMLGWENVFHCEINPFGRKVLDYWFPNSESYEDITKTDFSQYRGKIDILTGGFPCQPFSYAGKRGGEKDDRYLWHEMLRVIEDVRPMWVVGENVNGITTMVESYSVAEMGSESSLFDEGNRVHRYRSTQPFTIERICSDLESKGYSVQPMLVPACAVSAPHRRDRVFIIAYNVADSEDLLCNGSIIGDRGSKEREEMPKPGDNHSKDVADTKGKQGNGVRSKESEVSGTRQEQPGGRDCKKFASMLPGERWSAFPSVSAVHRGNDGFPFDVDNLTIPFAKWRTESLKAYGNAIVPQVLYQIFKCINAIN